MLELLVVTVLHIGVSLIKCQSCQTHIRGDGEMRPNTLDESVTEYEATSVTPMSCTNSTSINTCALQLSNIS